MLSLAAISQKIVGTMRRITLGLGQAPKPAALAPKVHPSYSSFPKAIPAHPPASNHLIPFLRNPSGLSTSQIELAPTSHRPVHRHLAGRKRLLRPVGAAKSRAGTGIHRQQQQPQQRDVVSQIVVIIGGAPPYSSGPTNPASRPPQPSNTFSNCTFNNYTSPAFTKYIIPASSTFTHSPLTNASTITMAAPLVQEPTIPVTSSNKKTEFDPKNALVVYILGGPGSGKGTQSERLVKDFNFTHLSAGDLLRAEQDREGSDLGQEIKDCIKAGLIVRAEVTVELLKNAMKRHLGPDGKGRFLVDGFPRKLDQMSIFEDNVCPSKLTLFLDCPEDVMRERLLNRGKTSGRSDDNEESIVLRFKTFVNESYPVVQAQEKEGKVVRISAVGTADEVYENVKKGLAEKGVHP